jgi:broad specificity phosphatase PhoE
VSTPRVFVWRHGRTAWNAQRRFQGQSDPPLDDVGLAQAQEAAQLLATFSPDLIVTSDLLRAAQTAAALSAITGTPAVSDTRLRERSLGHWEGLTREEVEVAYPDEFADWAVGREVTRRGGETREQVAERASEMFHSLPMIGTVVLVTHSATALALTGALLELSHSRHVLGPLANCHWTELQNQGGHYRLRAHNAGPAGAIIPLPPSDAGDEAADSPDAEALDAAGR